MSYSKFPEKQEETTVIEISGELVELWQDDHNQIYLTFPNNGNGTMLIEDAIEDKIFDGIISDEDRQIIKNFISTLSSKNREKLKDFIWPDIK